MAISTAQDYASADAKSGFRLLRLIDIAFTETLSGNKTLDADIPTIYKPDPGGSARDITLEAEADNTGLVRFIINGADAAENLVVKDDGASTVGTLNQNEAGLFFCDGTSWNLLCIFTIALS